MEHLSLKQLSLYPITTHFIVKAINLETGEIKVIKDIVYFEYSTKYLAYLKHLNCAGFNVFFFPAGAGGGRVDFLLDDVKKQDIDKLIADGLKPLYILETSPENWQAILRFDVNIQDKDEYLEINRYFVKKYNADAGSIGTEHFFRLAGYTNRKEKYCRNGQYPFVKLTVSGGALDKSLLPALTNKILKEYPTAPDPAGLGKKRQQQKNIPQPPALPGGEKKDNNSCDKYILGIYTSGGLADISLLDWKVARIGLSRGFSESEIAASMRKYSPDIENRKKGHIEDYISRTIRNASARP